MICVTFLVMNTYLSETSITLPPPITEGYKKGITARLPAGVTCTGVTRGNPEITEGIPAQSVTNGWFTINALKVGESDISFMFSNGVKEVIHVVVKEPSQPQTEATFTVPKTANKVILIIER